MNLLSLVNQFLSIVCACDTAFIRFLYVNKSGANRAYHKDYSLPLTERSLSSIQWEANKSNASVCVVPNAVKRAPKDASNPAGASDWEYVYRTFCPELDDANLTPEQQLQAWRDAGLPISYALFTGGKSVHPYVTFKNPVTEDEWQRTAYGFLTKYAAAAGVAVGSDAYDESCLNVGQAYKVPGFKHNKTGKLAETLVRGIQHKPENLSAFAVDVPEGKKPTARSKKQPKNRVYTATASTVEALQKLADEYISVAGFTSDNWLTVMQPRVEKKLAEVERGRNAPTAAWSISCLLGLLPTIENWSAEKAVSYVLGQLETTFSTQQRATAWDKEEYKKQVINGLIDGLEARLAELMDIEREYTVTKKVNTKYMSDIKMQEMSEKLLFVKSSIATGKTRAVVEVVKSLNYKARVLCISHRRMLDEGWLDVSSANELGIISYSDYNYGTSVGARDRASVVVDSLWKTWQTYDRSPKLAEYDLIVLDECSQLLHHLFTSDNTPVNKHRTLTVDLLRLLLSNAKRVICCDADLSDLEVNIVSELAKCDDKATICNEHLPYQKRFTFVDKEETLETILRAKLDAGYRCYVAMDNAAKAEQLAKRLNMKGKRELLITGETVDDFQDLCHSAEDEANKDRERKIDSKQVKIDVLKTYDCTVATQAMGTGVDLAVGDGSNTGNEPYDYVFGIFSEPDYSTFRDCLQALGRARYPKSNQVFVYCHQYLNFSTTSATAIRKLKKLRDEAIVPVGIEGDVDLANASIISFTKPDAKYAKIVDWTASYLSRKAEEGINRLGKMKKALEAAGHIVDDFRKHEEIAEAKEQRDEEKAAAKTGIRTQKAKEVAEADVLTREEVSRLINKGKTDKKQKQQIERYIISKKLGTTELTDKSVYWYMFGGGELASKLELLANKCPTEAFLDDKYETLERGVNGGYGASFHQESAEVIQRLEELVEPIINEGRLTEETARAAHEYALKHRDILGHKDIGLTVDKYAVRFISKYLGLRGWKTEEAEKPRDGSGDQKRVYQLTLNTVLDAYLSQIQKTYADNESARASRVKGDKTRQEFKLKQMEQEKTLAARKELMKQEQVALDSLVAVDVR